MFPVTDSNLCPDALVERVLSQYDLGAVTRCRLHHRGLNDTYKVECGQDHTYFLRIYRAGWRSRDEIDAEIAILLHLAQRQVKVSAPVRRTDAEILTPLDCAEGRRWAALFESAPGKEVDRKAYTDELAAAYGEAVAAIHSAADSFEGRRLRPALDLMELFERPLRLVTSTIAHRCEDVAYIDRLGTRLRSRIQDMAGLELGFCHGDFHGGNSCEQDKSFTFYDFDCCGWGYRAYDLAVFPWAFAIAESGTQRIEAMGRAFLQGYAQWRRLAAIDVDAIPVFVAIRQIWLMGLHIGLGDRFGWGWLNDGYFDRYLKILRDWEENWLDRPSAEWLRASDA
jgi:Ser/Thr protein kinase RdoA (MazF antagonist)